MVTLFRLRLIVALLRYAYCSIVSSFGYAQDNVFRDAMINY